LRMLKKNLKKVRFVVSFDGGRGGKVLLKNIGKRGGHKPEPHDESKSKTE